MPRSYQYYFYSSLIPSYVWNKGSLNDFFEKGGFSKIAENWVIGFDKTWHEVGTL